MPKPEFEQHDVAVAGGQRMVMWTTRPAQVTQPLPMIIGAGFARRMHHFAAIASYAAHNGIFVSRYDPINHVGLSEGEMWDFTLSDSLESLRTAVRETCRMTGSDKVVVVATSLTARVAFQLASESDKVALVVSAVGVVNVQETLKCVFGDDHSLYDPETMDGYVDFEGKHIERKNFSRDARKHDWWSVSGTVAALRRAKQPMIAFIGTHDEWVRPGEVEYVFNEGSGGPRKLLSLERATHDFSKNAAVARTFVLGMLREVGASCGAPITPVEPRFEELMEQSLLERRIQRAVKVTSAGDSVAR
jgi:acyl transferase